jgi:guanosine-3',5'-bis(diphosphate) 3'-pyrophosphohydrolase
MADLLHLDLIFDALAFAADMHRDQRRKNVEAAPYINHPIMLARILVGEGQVSDPVVICAALLHDTIEDTDATPGDIEVRFGKQICEVVLEVTDDKDLPRMERKRLQVAHSPSLSDEAKLVKLADKICNLRDVAESPPVGWNLERKQEYFDWARDVVAGLRGVSPRLESAFDRAYAQRPK